MADRHKNCLAERCRICGGDILKDKRKCLAISVKDKVKVLWGINVCLDSPNVHPSHICVKCRLICQKPRSTNNYAYHPSVSCIQWRPHTDDCKCAMFYLHVRIEGDQEKKERRKLLMSHMQKAQSTLVRQTVQVKMT